MSEEGKEVRKKYVSEDAQEVHEILSAVSEFIAGLKEPIKEFLDMLLSSLDGERLGKEVAKFYRELKESGMPEEMIREMVKEFFKRKLEAAPSLGSLAKMIGDALSSKGKLLKGIRGGVSGVPEDVVKRLDEIEKVVPEEYRGKIREVKEKLSRLSRRSEEEEEEEKEEESEE